MTPEKTCAGWKFSCCVVSDKSSDQVEQLEVYIGELFTNISSQLRLQERANIFQRQLAQQGNTLQRQLAQQSNTLQRHLSQQGNTLQWHLA